MDIKHGNLKGAQPGVAPAPMDIFSIANQLRYGLALLIILSLLITAGWLIYLAFQTQVQQLEVAQRERSRAVASEINAYVDDLQRKLAYLARIQGLADFTPQIQQKLLDGLSRHNDAYEIVAILNNTGQVITAVSLEQNSLAEDYANTPLFSRTYKQHEDYIGPVEQDPKTGVPQVLLAVPIRDQKDEVGGVLLAQINLEYLWYVVSQTGVGDTGYTYVLDNRNFLIAEKGSNAETFKLQDISDQSFIQNLTSGNMDPQIPYQGLKGQDVFGAMAPIRSLHWKVVVELSTSEAYAPIVQMVGFMGITLIIILIVTVGLGIYFSRQIILPLQSLTEASTQIRAGNMDVQVKISSHNEMGILARTFNEMAFQLKDLYGTLEQRIVSRTQHLEGVTTLSERLTAILKLEELLTEVVNQVKDRFDYYHAHIYLLNTQQEKLVVAAGTGEAGKVMLAQQHSVAKGRGIVGRAAEKNMAILVHNVTRTIGAEIVTKDNVAEIYQRETDPDSQTRWYRDYIRQYFSDFEGKSILKTDLKLGYVLHFKGAFTQILQKGAEEAARDLGVSVEVVAPAQHANANEALDLFSQMIQTGKDGVVVVPQFDKDWLPLLGQADIPVVTANRTGPNLASWLWIGQDSYESGFVLAKELVRQLQAQGYSRGQIVIGTDTPTAYDMMARHAGFSDGLQNTSFTVTDPYETTYDPASGYQIWKDLVEIHSDMIAAVGLSSGDIPNLAKLKSQSGAKWLIAGYDLDITTLEAVKTGLVQVAIGQHPYLQGYLPILALVEHLRYGRPLAEWQMENWLPNSLLPLTKAELAVPISLEGQVVGVLDVQSDKIGGLDESDANLLRFLANQIAVGIRNAHQFAEVETALAETRSVQQRYLEQSWEKVKILPRGGQYHYARPDAPALNGVDALVASVAIQDTPIGMVQLYPNSPNQAWTQDDQVVIEAISEELAQMAENLRLFDETRERATREATIREITDKLRAAPTLDRLLETAARELGQQLGVRHTVLELGIKNEGTYEKQ